MTSSSGRCPEPTRTQIGEELAMEANYNGTRKWPTETGPAGWVGGFELTNVASKIGL
jgi:hypothetical protein